MVCPLGPRCIIACGVSRKTAPRSVCPVGELQHVMAEGCKQVTQRGLTSLLSSCLKFQIFPSCLSCTTSPFCPVIFSLQLVLSLPSPLPELTWHFHTFLLFSPSVISSNLYFFGDIGRLQALSLQPFNLMEAFETSVQPVLADVRLSSDSLMQGNAFNRVKSN